MTATSVNRPSRKELVALGTAIVFSYVGAVVSAYLVQYSALNHSLEPFWWTGGVCWFLALVLPARFGYRLAKRQGWNGVIVVTLAVLPWIVLSGLFILAVANVSGMG